MYWINFYLKQKYNIILKTYDNDNEWYNENDNENMFITTDIYSISETNARHKYIGKSIKQ